MNQLTIEQQFEIAKLRRTIEDTSAEQLRELFVEFYEVMMKKDNATKALLAQQWGMDIETVDRSNKVKRLIDCGD